jgi:hypothetical protein
MGLTGPGAPAPARTQGVQIWSRKPSRRAWGEPRRTSRPQRRREPRHAGPCARCSLPPPASRPPSSRRSRPDRGQETAVTPSTPGFRSSHAAAERPRHRALRPARRPCRSQRPAPPTPSKGEGRPRRRRRRPGFTRRRPLAAARRRRRVGGGTS